LPLGPGNDIDWCVLSHYMGHLFLAGAASAAATDNSSTTHVITT